MIYITKNDGKLFFLFDLIKKYKTVFLITAMFPFSLMIFALFMNERRVDSYDIDDEKRINLK